VATEVEELFAKPQAGMDVVAEAARRYLATRLDKEEVEKMLDESKKRLDAAEALLFAKMDEAKVHGLKLVADDGLSYSISDAKTPYYSAPPGALDDSEFYRWLLHNGGHDLVKRAIHHMSFSSFCRELVEADKNLHPTVKMVEKRSIRVSKV
jgi:hypothetical protein